MAKSENLSDKERYEIVEEEIIKFNSLIVLATTSSDRRSPFVR